MAETIEQYREDAAFDQCVNKSLRDDVSRLTNSLTEANALATKWMRRFAESTEPGSAGAFSRRDHEIELRKAVEAERDSVMALNAQMLAEQDRLTADMDIAETALQQIAEGYGPNHLSKFARDVSETALKLLSNNLTSRLSALATPSDASEDR